jgi:hypothetical protein
MMFVIYADRGQDILVPWYSDVEGYNTEVIYKAYQQRDWKCSLYLDLSQSHRIVRCIGLHHCYINNSNNTN